MFACDCKYSKKCFLKSLQESRARDIILNDCKRHVDYTFFEVRKRKNSRYFHGFGTTIQNWNSVDAQNHIKSEQCISHAIFERVQIVNFKLSRIDNWLLCVRITYFDARILYVLNVSFSHRKIWFYMCMCLYVYICMSAWVSLCVDMCLLIMFNISRVQIWGFV